ncbi:hypothetical protein GF351_05310 [Candidatus Woesearchaeota archaeon]|nr:hypothetical protein [Candidatus Woesearchaeota archaeon]
MRKIVLVMILVLLTLGMMEPAAAVAGSGDISTGQYVDVLDEDEWEPVRIANSQVNQLPDPAEPGGYVELRWKVENLGSEEAENVIFELVPSYPFSLMPGDEAERRVGSVWGRQIGDHGVILYYKLKVDENAVEGDNEIRIRYSLDNGNSWTTFDFDIRIQTHDAILAVNEVEVEEDRVSPGKASEVYITVTNLADSLLKDLKFKLDLDDIPFAPIGSANEKVVEMMYAEEQSTVAFDLMAEPDAESGLYKVPLEISYQDELGTTYTRDLTMGLIVGDSPEIIIQIEDTEREASGDVTATVKIVNKGVIDIKFVTVHIKDTGSLDLASPEEYYVGNIDSDDYETAEFTWKDDRKKEVSLPVKITYKDANNNEFSAEEELEVKAPAAQGGGSALVGILIVILIVGAGVWFYLRWKKKQKGKSSKKQ